jgi:hypothetical protein
MGMHRFRRAAMMAVVLSALVAFAPITVAATTDQLAQTLATPASPETAPAERAHVDGFRSAKWGMTDAQVKDAIRKDFGIAPEKIMGENNLSERTTVLTVSVPDLLEGAGTARVSYIFGYASKKLIQVNLLWGGAVDPQASPDRIVAAANELRQLFVDAGYQADTVVANAKLPDGSILVFKGQDADKRTTILHLATGTVTPPAAPGAEPPKPVQTTALSLSYVLDAANPDIYRLKKGSF